MKCQILFSGKNKKTITNLSSTELVNRVIKVNLNTLFSVCYLMGSVFHLDWFVQVLIYQHINPCRSFCVILQCFLGEIRTPPFYHRSFLLC